MSYITITRRHVGSAYENTVCMTVEECKVLLPHFQKAYNEVKAKYEKYEDIHSIGEATERQQDLMTKYCSQKDSLESILSDMETVLKSFK